MVTISYRTFSDYVKEQFGEPVYKLPLDAGFSCPNLDGTAGTGGCSYCLNASFTPRYTRRYKRIDQQLEAGKKRLQARGIGLFFSYLQAHTNSYGPFEQLEKLYSRVINQPGAVGLCLGTRPDCLTPEVVELLGNYEGKGKEIWIEIGLQSSHDQTLNRINRCHDFSAYLTAIKLLNSEPLLKISPHLIFGLPGETPSMMLETVKRVVDLGLDGIKFHQLQVIKGTPLAGEFYRGEYSPLSYLEYRDILVEALRLLPEKTVVHRVMGESSKKLLLAPLWNQGKQTLINYLQQPACRS